MKVSERYTVSFLVTNPSTRKILLKHLLPVGVDEAQLVNLHATLKELADTNMGGGIPFDVIQRLVAELDSQEVTFS